MIEVCGLIGGAATRLFVWGSDYLNKKQQHEQDIERLRAQTDLERAKADANISEAMATKQAIPPVQIDDSSSTPDAPPTGHRYVDIANSAVRPALTYWYCLVLYTVYKGYLLLHGADPLTVATEFDRTLIASMVSYWFTDRTFHRLSQ